MRRAAVLAAILGGFVTIASAADDLAAPLSKRLVADKEPIRATALAELRALPEEERLRMLPQAIAGMASSYYWIDALQAIGPAALAEVVEAVGSEDPRIRSGALQVLARWPDRTVLTIPLVTAGLNDRDGTVRQWALRSVGKLGPMAAPLIPTLLTGLNDRNHRDQDDVVRAIGFMGSAGAPAARTLAGLLSAPWIDDGYHQYLRRVILETLPRLQPPAADVLPDVIRFLGDPGLNWQAEASLKLYGDAAIPYLVAATQDDNARVRAAAAERLRKFDTSEARAAIARYDGAEPARIARAAEEEETRSWTQDEIRAPLPQAAECPQAPRLAAESEFDLGGHGALLVTAHVADCAERPGAVRIWRRDGDGYRLVLRSGDEIWESSYGFTMTTLANQRLLKVSSVADGAYHFDRFFVVGDDAALTPVSFVPPESGCGSWLPIIGQEEYAGLEIRAEKDTVRFGFGETDLRPRDGGSHRATSWRGTLELTHSSSGAPQLRVATCQSGP